MAEANLAQFCGWQTRTRRLCHPGMWVSGSSSGSSGCNRAVLIGPVPARELIGGIRFADRQYGNFEEISLAPYPSTDCCSRSPFAPLLALKSERRARQRYGPRAGIRLIRDHSRNKPSFRRVVGINALGLLSLAGGLV